MGPVCLCGCGESLPEGSTRAFKRGHKDRATDPDSGFTETPLPEPGEDNEFATEGWPLNLSIDDAALMTPDDPEPRDTGEVKPPRPKMKITPSVRKDVQGKMTFALALGGQVWIMADPICGTAFVENTENIAAKLTPIICQSPDVVKWLTKSSNFILYVDLFMALWPVLQLVFAHHIAKSLELKSEFANSQGQTAPNAYVVQ